MWKKQLLQFFKWIYLQIWQYAIALRVITSWQWFFWNKKKMILLDKIYWGSRKYFVTLLKLKHYRNIFHCGSIFKRLMSLQEKISKTETNPFTYAQVSSSSSSTPERWESPRWNQRGSQRREGVVNCLLWQWLRIPSELQSNKLKGRQKL